MKHYEAVEIPYDQLKLWQARDDLYFRTKDHIYHGKLSGVTDREVGIECGGELMLIDKNDLVGVFKRKTGDEFGTVIPCDLHYIDLIS